MLVGTVSVGVGRDHDRGRVRSVGRLPCGPSRGSLLSKDHKHWGAAGAGGGRSVRRRCGRCIQGLLIGVLGINSLVFTIGTSHRSSRPGDGFAAHEQTITMPIEQLFDVDILTHHFLGIFSPAHRVSA